MSASQESELTGKLLVAMPGIGDPRFKNAVIYLCAHSAEGAMGLVINKLSPDVDIDDVYDQSDLKNLEAPDHMDVHIGGPVETGRGFVLHNAGYMLEEETLVVDAAFAMTASQTILKDIALKNGPRDFIFCLGYSGWGPAQLEDELATNGWLVCEAKSDIVFQVDESDKWARAIESLGVNPALLSAEAGNA